MMIDETIFQEKFVIHPRSQMCEVQSESAKGMSSTVSGVPGYMFPGFRYRLLVCFDFLFEI